MAELQDVNPVEQQNEVVPNEVKKNVLTELQDAVQDSLDQIQESTTTETKSEESNRFMPGPLPARGHEIADILDSFQSILLSEDAGNTKQPNGPFQPPTLDPVNKAATVAHSLAAYVMSLDNTQLQKLSSRITSDTTLWISRLFRFFDSSSCFHEEPFEGLVRLCRALLRIRYPKFEEDGYESLYSRPPVIYISMGIKGGLGKHLCAKLGLPRSSVCLVPCNTVFGSQYKMDVSQLERMIADDLSAQKTPLLVVASAGSSVVGQVDNLQRLQEICKLQDLWLHVEGDSLAGLCLVQAPTLPAKIGDSMTLPLGQWLGITSIPNILLYKPLDPAVTIASGLTAPTPQQKLLCLPIWIVLQVLGHNGVIGRIQHAFQLAHHLYSKLVQIPNIKLLGRQHADKDTKPYNVSDVTSKAVSASVLFDVLTPSVVFQYYSKGPDNKDESILSEKGGRACSMAYFNSLNSWLGQILQRDLPGVPLYIIEQDNQDVCLRFCPLDGPSKRLDTSIEILDSFINFITQQVGILNATVKYKEAFPSIILAHPNLQQVELKDWAGLGGVRYIPDVWTGNLSDLPDTGKEEVNRINQELVFHLKNTDSAFSLGEGDDGLYCVRFGMVTDDTDMDELLELVMATGSQIEESSKYFETMSEMVKKGIETASEGLKKENDERIWQEGVLRHVPVFGNIFNWWSPMPKETGVKGRSFNLSSGVIESTENTYKYHMQIDQGSPKAGTPKPVVQTMVATSTHSRSSSKSSTVNDLEEGVVPLVAEENAVAAN